MKFVITAGHDDARPGNTWQGVKEADLMLDLRQRVADRLRAMGHVVVEDGARGVNQPLSWAMKLINRVDAAVELHTNASTDTNANGVEVVADAKHKELARALAISVSNVMTSRLRRLGGWYDHETYKKEKGSTAGFVRSGGLILETFFQSNALEYHMYQSRRDEVADAIAQTLDSFGYP